MRSIDLTTGSPTRKIIAFAIPIFISIVLSLLVIIFAPNLVAIFSDSDADVIAQGARYLRIEGVFYILIAYLFIHYGFYRG